jgi:hypothetical protein
MTLLLQQICSKLSPQGCRHKAGSDANLGGLACGSSPEPVAPPPSSRIPSGIRIVARHPGNCRSANILDRSQIINIARPGVKRIDRGTRDGASSGGQDCPDGASGASVGNASGTSGSSRCRRCDAPDHSPKMDTQRYCRLTSASAPDRLQTGAHRQGRRRVAAANQIPVRPRSRVENPRRGLFQHFAIFVFADDPAQRLQILDRAEHHDMCEEL